MTTTTKRACTACSRTTRHTNTYGACRACVARFAIARSASTRVGDRDVEVWEILLRVTQNKCLHPEESRFADALGYVDIDGLTDAGWKTLLNGG